MKVTIVLATFNPHLDFFREQIESIKKQTFKDWNCIITDDQSKNEIYAAMKDILDADPRFKLIQNTKNQGSVYNFENGLRHIDHEVSQDYWIAFCDQDDIWKSTKLEKMLTEAHDSHVMLIHSDLEVIDAQGSLLHKSCWEMERREVENTTYSQLIFRNSVTGCACLFRASLISVALPFIENIHRAYHHDVWLALIALCRGKIVPIYEPLVLYRQHGSNQVGGAGVRRNRLLILKMLFNPGASLEKCVDAYEFRCRLAEDFYLRTQIETFFNKKSKQNFFLIFKNFGMNKTTFMVFIGFVIQKTRRFLTAK